MTAYYDRPEYRSAVAHPFHVALHASWEYGCEPLVVGFQSEDAARAFAASRPEPLVDLVRRGCGIIASRRLVGHPLNKAIGSRFTPRDDFPATK